MLSGNKPIPDQMVTSSLCHFNPITKKFLFFMNVCHNFFVIRSIFEKAMTNFLAFGILTVISSVQLTGYKQLDQKFNQWIGNITIYQLCKPLDSLTIFLKQILLKSCQNHGTPANHKCQRLHGCDITGTLWGYMIWFIHVIEILKIPLNSLAPGRCNS